MPFGLCEIQIVMKLEKNASLWHNVYSIVESLFGNRQLHCSAVHLVNLEHSMISILGDTRLLLPEPPWYVIVRLFAASGSIVVHMKKRATCKDQDPG
jgi:hypothetical protein